MWRLKLFAAVIVFFFPRRILQGRQILTQFPAMKKSQGFIATEDVSV